MRPRRIVLAASAFLLLVYVAWNVHSATGVPSPDAPIAPVPSRTPFSTSTSAVSAPNRVSYSIALNDIAGLGPATSPGTVVDLWVAWDPPITETPKLDRLLPRVTVERIAPPVTLDGPTVVVLSVAQRDVDELLWADRYGSLSAVALPALP